MNFHFMPQYLYCLFPLTSSLYLTLSLLWIERFCHMEVFSQIRSVLQPFSKKVNRKIFFQPLQHEVNLNSV